MLGGDMACGVLAWGRKFYIGNNSAQSWPDIIDIVCIVLFALILGRDGDIVPLAHPVPDPRPCACGPVPPLPYA